MQLRSQAPEADAIGQCLEDPDPVQRAGAQRRRLVHHKPPIEPAGAAGILNDRGARLQHDYQLHGRHRKEALWRASVGHRQDYPARNHKVQVEQQVQCRFILEQKLQGLVLRAIQQVEDVQGQHREDRNEVRGDCLEAAD